MERVKFLPLVLFICILYVSFLSASQLSPRDIPNNTDSILKYSSYFGKERLVTELWEFLPDKISFQDQLDRGRFLADKCVKAMQGLGWTMKKENRQRRGGEFLFLKEVINSIKVTVAPGTTYREGKIKKYIFYKYEYRRLIPYDDVTGYDYPDVPRYPGSIRVRWMDLLGDFAAKYLVVGTVEEVKKFFKTKLAEYDWQPGRGAGTLNYLKGGYKSRETKTLNKEDIKDPIKMATGLIPTTLSVFLSEKEGIIEIGIGRSAGAADKGKEIRPEITPAEKPRQLSKKKLTFIDHEKDLPTYPGLKRKHVECLPVNVAGQEIIRLRLETGAVAPVTAVQIAKFYIKEMKTKSWTLRDDEWHGLGRRLLFEKEAVQVKINIKAIGRYPIPESAAKRKINIPVQIDVILPIPQKELTGKDIEGVPRFPGSVRFYYLEAALDHMVKYKAAAAVKEVEWFYINNLPETGWTFAGYDSTGLLFVPSSTAKSAGGALAKGKLIPTTLKLKVDDMWNGTVKIGLTKTRGD